MTEQATADNAVSLSSTDGWKWTNINGQPVDAANVEGTVTRIVIGELGEEKEVQHGAELLQEALDHHGETITHLHLWNLKNLDHLENLPPNLQCLDLRGCSALTRIPDLPETLETLDLEGCENLKNLPDSKTPKLEYLHLDDCKKLTSATINNRIGASPRLKELTLSNCTQLYDLAELAQVRSPLLRKVVLKGCEKLAALPDLSEFKRLDHLNLNGCSSLVKLPRLPIPKDPELPSRSEEPEKSLQYLVAHGCDSLREYQGLDLRPVHLSDHDDDNIIDTFRALEYLGQPPKELLAAKLLLLGSGRVGKTTLAKALLWPDADADSGITEQGQDKRPWVGSASTDNIQFWPWRGTFKLDDQHTARKGSVLIWDFAGQEYYHNTHRLFVASGAVFAIVVCDRDTHRARLQAEIQRRQLVGSKRDEFLERNQYRPISYWLDFVRSALGIVSGDIAKLPVILVNSAPVPETYLLEQAGRYTETIAQIPVYTLVCNDQNYVSDLRFKRLKKGLEKKLGQAADQLGIRVPRFYKTAQEKIEGLFSPGQSYPTKPFFEYEDWTHFLKELLGGDRGNPAFVASVMRAVSRYLHRIGQVFWLDEKSDSAVIVDQQVGVRTIYSLCESSTSSSLLQDESGLMPAHHLKLLVREVQNHFRDRVLSENHLLELLEKCDICVPIRDDLWQALNPSLLPKSNDIQSEINRSWFSLANSSEGFVNHCFRLNAKDGRLIGSADMQAVAAWLARNVRAGMQGQGLPRWLALGQTDSDSEAKETQIIWRAEWTFWLHGVQIAWHPECRRPVRHAQFDIDGPAENIESTDSAFLIRIQYASFEADDTGDISYDGSLYIELLTRDERQMSERLKIALFSDSGPLAFLDGGYEISDTRPEKHPPAEIAYPRDAAMWPWKKARQPGTSPDRYDVAISVRRADVAVARELHQSLYLAGLRSHFYVKNQEKRPGTVEEEVGLLDTYKILDNAEVLVLVCSSHYFDLSTTCDNKGNLFCPVELAAAVYSLQRSTNPRQKSQIVILACEDEGFRFSGFDSAVEQTLTSFRDDIILKRITPASSSLLDWENERVILGYGGIRRFLDLCGQGANQNVIWDGSESTMARAVAEVVRKVKAAREMP